MKTLVTVIALSLATAFSANAQVNQPMNNKVHVASQQEMTKQVKAHTNRMTTDLTLSADQQARVMELNNNLYTDMSTAYGQNLKSEDMDAIRTRSLDRYNSSLEQILDENQYTKYSSLEQQYMSDMESTRMKNSRTNMSNTPSEKSVTPAPEMRK